MWKISELIVIMRTIVVFSLLIAAVTGVPSNPQKIVGGSIITIDQWPTITSLLYSWDLSVYWQSCAGTILNSRSVLTAAHCTFGDRANRWRFRVGSTFANIGGVVYSASTIINHPEYISFINDNDIAIIHSSSTILFSDIVAAGSIAGSNYSLADNQVVWAAGWGTTALGGQASEQLRHVQIWTVNQATCRDRYASIGATVTDNMLCSGWLDVGGRDQCQGDSGGPLTHNNVLVGVCSWGYGCAEAYFPGVNARVSRYTAWIQANA